MDDSTCDKKGILSHQGTFDLERLCPGYRVPQSLTGEVQKAEKTPNRANLESMQG
jgi:hypothetical protein